jgi:hypothetical protein
MASAMWQFAAVSNDYNNPSNWVGDTVPSKSDTALFDITNQTNISIKGAEVNVGSWELSTFAFIYHFTVGYSTEFDFYGAGIVNDGGENTGVYIAVDNLLQFLNHSTAGLATITGDAFAGTIKFLSYSNAGSSNIVNNFSLYFANHSNGETATIDNNGAVVFLGSSSAAHATIDTAPYNNVQFHGSSNGGQAKLVTDAGGLVDFSLSAGPGHKHEITVGSIAGAGTYNLGADQLTVGLNGISTTASGPIENGGLGGGSTGSLVKKGHRTLTLSHAHNTYSCGTKLEAGGLDLAAVRAAGTGAITFAGTARLKIENGALSHHTFIISRTNSRS